MSNPELIMAAFHAILDDEQLLDDLPIDLIESIKDQLTFYLMDRDLGTDELDFH